MARFSGDLMVPPRLVSMLGDSDPIFRAVRAERPLQISYADELDLLEVKRSGLKRSC